MLMPKDKYLLNIKLMRFTKLREPKIISWILYVFKNCFSLRSAISNNTITAAIALKSKSPGFICLFKELIEMVIVKALNRRRIGENVHSISIMRFREFFILNSSIEGRSEGGQGVRSESKKLILASAPASRWIFGGWWDW